MRTKMTLSVLLLSAVCATPAFANYFSNQSLNINLNIGSAASPTPRDVRENRQPKVVRAVPSDANVVADDTTKNTGNLAVIDHAAAQAGEGKSATVAQLPRQ
jgi:hypothetical protein